MALDGLMALQVKANSFSVEKKIFLFFWMILHHHIGVITDIQSGYDHTDSEVEEFHTSSSVPYFNTWP